MTAEIVDISTRLPPPNLGNGAREAMVSYWTNFAAQNNIGTAGWPGMMADNLLGFLWNDGFKVVPLETRDAEYEGPEWTGEEAPA